MRFIDTNLCYKVVQNLFYKERIHSNNKYTEDTVDKILRLLTDNIFATIHFLTVHQSDNISIGTNCATLLRNVLLI